VPVQIDVLQASRGRQILAGSVVKQYAVRSKPARWNGRGARGDGVYVTRFLAGGDTQLVTLLRRDGRFEVRPAFARRPACDVLSSFQLDRPAFGGSKGTALGIAFTLASRATAQVTVLRGAKVAKRFPARTYEPGRANTLTLRAAGLRRGEHKVRITVGKTTATLVSRRL
jgi:hypothetical protein